MTMSVFDSEHFAHPSNEHRPLQIVHGLDGWLTDPGNLRGEEGIDRNLRRLLDLGQGGIVTNVSFNHYLQSERQWEIFLYGAARAAELGLVLWLYDEDGYPSGTAGGLVTRANPEFVARGLAGYVLRAKGPGAVRFDRPASCEAFEAAFAFPLGAEPTGAAVVDLSGRADPSGTLCWEAPAGDWTVLYLARRVMYEGTHSAGNVHEFKHYINVLDDRAVAEFLRLTHEQYWRRMPKELAGKVRAVFTDEPSLMVTYVPELPERYRGQVPVVDRPLFADRPAAVPWHSRLPEWFRRAKGYELRPHLWALFCGRGDEAAYVRQDFHETVSRRFAEAYSEQIARWCAEHGTAFSGHFMAEESLYGHVTYLGSLFAVVRPMQLPGIDMLNSDPRSMLEGGSLLTAKQVASAAHLTGAGQVHSECSDWSQRNAGKCASLAERRGQGNLLYSLGVNQVTAYWSWQELGEQAGRLYNDYMGRLASLLRGGRHVCDVAVLYPIRSVWASFVPESRPPTEGLADETLADRGRRVRKGYEALVRGLIRGQIDLDIVDEEALAAADSREGALRVAGESYRIVILPPIESLGLAAARALLAFGRAGGTVIATAEPPGLADSPANAAELGDVLRQLFGPGGAGRVVAPEKLAADLRRRSVPDLLLAEPNADITYTHRVVEDRDLYFLANHSPEPVRIRPAFRVRGPYQVYRPLGGRVEPAGDCAELALEGYEGTFVVAAVGR
jgi:hypothetical protein